MEEEVSESLVARRSRRSTAGNRMESALADLALEDANEPEEDNDFTVDNFEEDVFGSDFESTDEEAAKDDMETGEQAVREEERRVKKAGRTRVEKMTALAHKRNKDTFNPEVSTSVSNGQHPAPKSRKSRVALGSAIDAETGEVVSGVEGLQRQSRRKHTVLNTTATARRLQKSEEKRAMVPKKAKPSSRIPSQTTLIQQALDLEDVNKDEHRNYLQLEEEKRRKAKVVRPSIQGPLVRWISQVGEDTINEPASTPASSSKPAWPYSYTSFVGPGVYPSSYGQSSYGGAFSYHPYMTPDASAALTSNPVQATNAPYSYYTTPPTNPPAPEQVERKLKVAKNFAVYELGQFEGVQKPEWGETMTALFGDHVVWEDVRAYSGKNRPMARKKQTCPITGLPAQYLDPQTGVPYANTRAFKILRSLLSHEYIWNDTLGCYLGKEDPAAM